MITAIETRRYETVWNSLSTYGDNSPGLAVLPVFLDLAGAADGATVLDMGCGNGKVGLALQKAGFTVQLADLTPEGLCPEARTLPFQSVCIWHPIANQLDQDAVDLTFCVDVLEHVPEALTMLAVDRLLTVTRGHVFLGISLIPDEYGVFVGETLHHTVHPFTWWRDLLREICDVEEARDLVNRALFWVSR